MSEYIHRAYIGLGSNLDNPRRHVELAISALDQLPLTQLVVASPLYSSKPVGPKDQPDFINAVACVSTRLSPLALLDQLQAMEQHHRRRRQYRWGPRTLDLDILLFDNLILNLPRLVIPHPAMLERAFVLVPLADIAPQARLNDKAISSLAGQLNSDDLQLLAP